MSVRTATWRSINRKVLAIVMSSTTNLKGKKFSRHEIFAEF